MSNQMDDGAYFRELEFFDEIASQRLKNIAIWVAMIVGGVGAVLFYVTDEPNGVQTAIDRLWIPAVIFAGLAILVSVAFRMIIARRSNDR